MEEVKTTEETNTDKVSNCLGEMIDLLSKEKLTVPELILLLSNLQYAIGASIEGYKEDQKGPNLEQLKKVYYTAPTVGVSMMLAAMEMSTWHDSYLKQLQNTKEKEDK